MKSLTLLFLASLLLGMPTIAADAPRPNILFIIFDDWGWQHAGAYGCDWVKTPNFDRVAREGVLFKSAFTSNPKCSPCRATILTGRNSWQLEEAVCHGGIFPPKFAVYPDILEKSGYAVGLTGKGWGPGKFELEGRTRNPAGPSFDKHKLEVPAKGIQPSDYAANFSDFLATQKSGQPFCFWCGFKEPHRSYEEGSGVRLGKKLAEVTVPGYLPDNEVVRSDLADYAIEVEWADAQIGRVLDVLTKSGQLDNTLIIVTSDHGMPFPRVKGQIYEDGYHLPLAMRWGNGIKPGRVVEDFINVRDLAPTYLELANLKPHEQMSGKSLVNILRSEKSGFIEDRKIMLAGKERHDIGRPNDWGYPVRAIRTTEFFYSHNYHPERWPACNPETGYGNCDDGPTKTWLIDHKGPFYDLAFSYRAEEELYDIVTDPECLKNLATEPKHAAKKKELRTQMESILKDEKDPRALADAAIFDTYKYLGNRAKKGYAEWEARQKGQLALSALISGICDRLDGVPDCQFSYDTTYYPRPPDDSIARDKVQNKTHTETRHFEFCKQGAKFYIKEFAGKKLMNHAAYDGKTYYLLQVYDKSSSLWVGSFKGVIAATIPGMLFGCPCYVIAAPLILPNEPSDFQPQRLSTAQFWTEIMQGVVVRMNHATGAFELEREVAPGIKSNIQYDKNFLPACQVLADDYEMARLEISESYSIMVNKSPFIMPQTIFNGKRDGKNAPMAGSVLTKLDPRSFTLLKGKPPIDFSIPRTLADRLIDTNLNVRLKR